MVNNPKENLSQLPVGKYGKSTKEYTWRRDHAKVQESGFEAERARALGALRSLWSKKRLSAEKRMETHFLCNKEKVKWIEDNVNGETAAARKRVQDAETATMQEQDHLGYVEKARSTSTKLETTCKEMLSAIGDSLSDLASSEDEEDGEDEDDDEKDTELGELSDDDEPGWVMGTISKTVLRRMESFRQKQMRPDELTNPGWRDAAVYFHEIDMKHGTTELKVPAVVKPQTDTTAATPSSTTFRELMQVLDNVPGQSQILQVTSQQGNSQMRLGLENPQADDLIISLRPDASPDLSQMEIGKPVQPVSYCPCT